MKPFKRILLGSSSPRRRDLITSLGWEFERVSIECEEDHPEELSGQAIAEFLANEKSRAYTGNIKENEVLLTADTVVWCQNEHLAKPKGEQEAQRMLRQLSNNTHEVITAVALRTRNKHSVFSETTRVHFRELQEEEINFYIREYQPFDKAGSYGIQEWIGMIGIERIDGCYFNVVGLPIQRLSKEMRDLGLY